MPAGLGSSAMPSWKSDLDGNRAGYRFNAVQPVGYHAEPWPPNGPGGQNAKRRANCIKRGEVIVEVYWPKFVTA